MRLGLVSTARINGAIVDGAARTDAVDVVAVASRDAARADRYAREHAILRAYASYDALLEDTGVDAVYIPLPNSLHVEWTVRALDAGKHVLCEKPFDRRPERVERAFDAAEARALVLMEAFMYRHHPQTARLGDVLASGAVGEVRNLRSSFCFLVDDPENVRLRAELDGGALMDLGCYCVNVCRFVAGEPELVFARQRIGPTGVDIALTAVLEYANGVHAEFHCAFDLPYQSGFEVLGSEGSIVVPEPFTCRDPHLVVNGGRVNVEDDDRYKLQLENFAAAIRGDAPPLLGRDDAVRQARTIDALYRSAESGTGVSP